MSDISLKHLQSSLFALVVLVAVSMASDPYSYGGSKGYSPYGSSYSVKYDMDYKGPKGYDKGYDNKPSYGYHSAPYGYDKKPSYEYSLPSYGYDKYEKPKSYGS
jgi:hypothetical protein